MAWKKLDNPKPSNGQVNPRSIKVTARELKLRGNGGVARFIKMKIGSKLAEGARFIATDHRCHIMVGSGSDAGQIGISMDDQAGKFKATRRADGRYEVVIPSRAADGQFALQFPPFERQGSVPAAARRAAGHRHRGATGVSQILIDADNKQAHTFV